MSQPTLLTRRHAIGLGLSDRQLHREAESGALLRIQRGAYSDRDGATPRERHVLRIHASGISEETVVSDWSAAVLHGLPVLGAHLDQVHVIRATNCANRPARLVRARKATLQASEVCEIEGVRCTSLERTVRDLISYRDFGEALAVADAALRMGVNVAELKPDPRAPKRALHVMSLADRRSESFLESVSRAKLDLLEIPQPELQVEVFDGFGQFIARVDMAWPDRGVIGEADGNIKYSERFGRTADLAIADEKRRQQQLEALGWTVVRWDFAAVRGDGSVLERHLRAAFARASHLPTPQGSTRLPPR